MKYISFMFGLVLFIKVQAQDPKVFIEHYIAAVRTGNNESIPPYLSFSENSKKTLAAIAPYLKDTSAIVRVKSYNIVRIVGLNSRQSLIRERVVADLVHAIRDKNTGNSATASGYLQSFYLADFSGAAKDSLRNIYKTNPNNFSKVVMLVGFVQLQELKQSLNELVQNTKASKQNRWAARIALSRLGDGTMTRKILEKVKGIGVNDDFIYDALPDLIYTRQPEMFTYLVEILNSDALSCSTAGGESTVKIPCAYRVMEALAPVIKDYPLKLNASGDINTKDYPAALKTVRAWFSEHKSYTIITNTY